MSVEILTFGCRLNTLESETMRARADEAGLRDAVLVNTCAVTAEAVRQAKQAIRRAKRAHPDRPVIVSGCAAQTDADAFASMPEVDRVVGNEEKLIAGVYGADVPRVVVGDIMVSRSVRAPQVNGIDGRSRAFVQVQTGCDHRCTFCVIPFGRGNSRSLPVADVVDQVRRFVANGYREVVLTGVDLTSWGNDVAGVPRLGALVRAILRDVPELSRLRLSSIDSIEVDDELMAAIAEEERLMPHFHLSLQHGDDLILKRMKRRHLRADSIRFVQEVRRLRPDVVFGADLIAGFPTENEAMFQNSLRIVEECGLTFLHVFPFSPRPGTPAARMPQLDRGLIKARAARLREAGAAALRLHLESQIGAERSVLMERENLGRTEHFTLAEISGSPGTMLRARITGATARGLTAVALAA
jgi:threonylcarbamoyladenosine tRNA methylthiotransferase MtaB